MSMAFPAQGPAKQAREILSGALQALQEDASAMVHGEAVTEHIAKAVGALFGVERVAPDDPAALAGVKDAMGHLSRTLAALQEVAAQSRGITVATECVAKTLALLYTVGKAQERASMPQTAKAAHPMREPAPHPGRKKPRVALDADIGFQSDTNFYTGFSEDLSDGGLFIATYNLLPVGAEVTINFTLPDGHLVVAKGYVTWVREFNDTTPDVAPGIGVQFDGLTENDMKSIRSFLRKRAPMFYAE